MPGKGRASAGLRQKLLGRTDSALHGVHQAPRVPGWGLLLKKKSKRGYAYYACEQGTECGFMSWEVPTAEDCPKCGKTLFKKSGRGRMKPFCINEACEAFLPEDKRGYYKKKTATEGTEGEPAGEPVTEKKTAKKPSKKTAAKKTAAKKPAAKKTAAKKPASKKSKEAQK